MKFKETPKYSSINELFINGPAPKVLKNKLKFKEIVREFDIENPSIKLIEYLISHQFYIECKELYEYSVVFDPNDYALGHEFIHNNISYVTSPAFIDELYNYLEAIIKDLWIRNYANDKDEIDLKILGLCSKEQQNILNKIVFKSKGLKGEKSNYFLKFLGHNKESWKDLIIDFFTFENEIFELYLHKINFEKIKTSRILSKFLPIWLEFYRRKKVIEHCESIIKELEPKKRNFNTNELGLLIFIEDGENVFNFLESNYKKEKNKAFYSYLYQFLQLKSKLVDNIKADSKEYRDYIIQTKRLKSYSRIIQTNSYSNTTKNKMFEAFENFLKSYSE